MPTYQSDYMRDRGHKCKKSCEGMGKEFVAGTPITAGTFVMFSGADDIRVIPCTAAAALIGVAMHDAIANETISVQMDGYHWIVVGTAAGLLPGDWVESDANAMAVEFTCPTAGNETTLGGYILTTPTDDEDCVCIKIQPDRLCAHA